VGSTVACAIENNCQLEELSLEKLKTFSSLIEQDGFDLLTLEGSVKARDHLGGTAPSQVEKAAAAALALINTRD
jgi:argininosuccinate lyase